MKLQKRLASEILKVGESKIWIDPSKVKDVEKAITRRDVKNLIKKGYIKALPSKVRFPKARKRRKGRGSRKGSKYSVISRKRRWVLAVRAQRRFLKELKEKDLIDSQTFKKVYRLVKGGMFRSKSHLNLYLKQHNLLKVEK